MTIERTDLANGDHEARLARALGGPQVRTVTVVIPADTSAFERAARRLTSVLVPRYTSPAEGTTTT